MEAFIPFARPIVDGNELKYLTEAINHGHLTHIGRFEKDFERALTGYLGNPTISTSSGTGALHLALLALRVGRGDEVVVPDLTFGATAAVVLAVGATPVMVDIDPLTWGPSKLAIQKVICKKTRVILSVNLYGEAAEDLSDMNVPVVEDACESFGIVPPRGELTCFSFYGNKVISTGEGGAICGEDLRDIPQWRDGGFDDEYRHMIPGLNYRMSNMQAAIGLAQMERVDELLSRRLANAKAYAQRLPGRGKWLFVVSCDNPILLAQRLNSHGIESRPVFTPLHRCPAFRQYARGRFVVADEVWRTGLALPTGPHVTEQQVERICNVIKGKA